MQHRLPAPVLEAVQSNNLVTSATIHGTSGTCALHLRGETLFWQATGSPRADVLVRSLPYSSEGQHHLAIVSEPERAEVAYALCSSEGNLTVWTNIFTEDAPMLTHRLGSGKVSAFTAAMTPDTVTTAAATADGSLHIVQAPDSTSAANLSLVSRTISSSTTSSSEPLQRPGRLSRIRVQQQQPAQTLHAFPGHANSLQFYAPDVGSTDLSLLAMTAQGINCYQIGRDTDQFLWSVDINAALTAGSPDAQYACVSMTVPRLATGVSRRIAVLAKAADKNDQTIAVAVLPSSGPCRIERTHAVHLPPDTDHILSNTLADAFLLWGEGIQPTTWTQAGTRQLPLPRCLAAALSADASHWLLLLPDAVASLPIKSGPLSPSRSYYPHIPRSQQQRLQQQLQPEPLVKQESPSSGSEATHHSGIDEATQQGSVDRTARALDAATASVQPVRGLYSALEGAGAFSGSAAGNPIAVYSSRLVDALPKHWTGAGEGASAADQLAAKLRAHETLLRVLAACGALQALPASSIRVVFEASEKAEALLHLRRLENELLAAARDAGRPAILMLPTQDCVALAGRRARPQASTVVEQRSDWELCYSRPSVSAPELLNAIAERCASVPDSRPSQALDELKELAEVLKVAMDGAQHRRRQHMRLYAEALQEAQHAPGPIWTCASPSQWAHIRLVDAFVRLTDPLQADAPERATQRAVDVSLVAERALDVMATGAGSIADPHASSDVREIYAREKDHVLSFLFGDAVHIDQSEAQDSMVDLPGQEQGTLSQAGPWLLDRLEQLAVQHQGYEAITLLCELNQDQGRLHEHMLRSLHKDVRSAPGSEGLAANCAEFVFAHYLASDRKHDLLQLPDDFNAALSRWLDQQADTLAVTQLRARHALRCGQYTQAGQQYLRGAHSGQEVLETAQQSLALAKLCAVAAAPDGLSGTLPPQVASSVRHVEADQALAQVQHDLFLYEQPPLPPLQLAEAALKSPADASLVFDVLAAAGQDFRLANREVAEAAWRKCISGTDWQSLVRKAGRLSDQEQQQLLAQTPLAAAAAKCYAPHPQQRSLCLGEGMRSLLPQEQVQELLERHASSLPGAERQQCFQAFQLGAGAFEPVLVNQATPMAV